MHAARSSVLFALGLAVSLPAAAHHSRANFDLDKVVELDGVIKEFSWTNPHAYVVLEVPDASGKTEDWTFELNSTPVLKRFGWNEHSLAVGDKVHATGNPDRDSTRRFIYGNLFRKADGTEIWSWGGPAQPSAPAEVTKGSTDFSGVWRFVFEAGYDVLGRNRPDDVLVNTLPVTAKGQAEVDAFDPDDNPEWNCEPRTMPLILGYPYPFEITHVGSDLLRIDYEVNNDERIVHLDQNAPPPGTSRTPLGYSIGHIDGRVLTIETSMFSHVRWGAGTGVDSGEQKHTVERYTLSDDGKELSLEFTMEDPEYLSKPVTETHRYSLNTGYVLQDYACDPATSRRHLTAGKDGNE
jgi:hypothetical protein